MLRLTEWTYQSGAPYSVVTRYPITPSQQPWRTPHSSAALHQLRGSQCQQHQANVAGLVPCQDTWLRGKLYEAKRLSTSLLAELFLTTLYPSQPPCLAGKMGSSLNGMMKQA